MDEITESNKQKQPPQILTAFIVTQTAQTKEIIHQNGEEKQQQETH